MIKVQDVKTKELFEFDTQELAQAFIEDYDFPHRLTWVD
jgi:hypothetical protein